MSDEFCTLADCFLAYRKAKAEAFYENTHFHALAFAEYERNLMENLRRLHKQLCDPSAGWARSVAWLGSYLYAPKSVGTPGAARSDAIYFRYLDPIEEWNRAYYEGGGERVKATFRLVIAPTVNFQVVSALWLLKVGHKYDGAISSELELTRFSGHLIVRFGGVRHGGEDGPVRAGV